MALASAKSLTKSIPLHFRVWVEARHQTFLLLHLVICFLEANFCFTVKYAELKQSLDYVEKEREIDLKEREAIVYRAESLQREFDHVNKLLQVF